MKKKEISKGFSIRDNPIFLKKSALDKARGECPMSKDGYGDTKSQDINEADAIHKNLIFCIGAANVDYKLLIEDEVIFETSNPAKRVTSFGGVARNIAENLARLDEDVVLMTKIGNDLEGSNILKDASPIMHIYPVDREQSMTTGTYIAVLDTKRNLLIGVADMKICDTMDDTWIKNHSKDISKADIIVCDTNVQKPAVEELQNISDKKIVLIGVSVAKTNNIPDKLKNIHLLILNKDEAVAYSGCDEFDYKKVCENLKKKGVQRCIITMGKDGCICYDDTLSPVILSTELIQDVVDVTGAGDSFSAGVVYAISNDKSLDVACKYGMRMAQLNIRSDESVVKYIPMEIFEDLDSYFDISYEY